MPYNKFTDDEIIKALEWCGEDLCSFCPFYDDELGCDCNLQFLALDLIRRQKQQIEHFSDIGKMYSEVRAEAIREFAERLKEVDDYVSPLDIDYLVKEMTEGQPCL